MTKTMKDAFDEVSTLPDADQDAIGRQLLVHVDKLRRLRADIDRGLRSLDAGQGRPLDIEDMIRRGKDRHGRA